MVKNNEESKYRVKTGFVRVVEILESHGILWIHFLGLKSPEIEVESHGKTIDFLRLNRQKKLKVEKTADKSENQLIPVKK